MPSQVKINDLPQGLNLPVNQVLEGRITLRVVLLIVEKTFLTQHECFRCLKSVLESKNLAQAIVRGAVTNFFQETSTTELARLMKQVDDGVSSFRGGVKTRSENDKRCTVREWL